MSPGQKMQRWMDILLKWILDYKIFVSWSKSRTAHVKNGTKAITVDLDDRSCDCREYDLTGIPCAHAIAAIHDRRHNPIDYLSEYYKMALFLATYNNSLEAINRDEYWEVIFTDELLPPDIPKKLIGSPKKLSGMEQWEGEIEVMHKVVNLFKGQLCKGSQIRGLCIVVYVDRVSTTRQSTKQNHSKMKNLK